MTDPKKILIYRMGFLGDALATLPSIWAVKENFPKARLFLLSQKQMGKRVLPKEIFEGSGFFDDFFFYPVDPGWFGKLVKPPRLLGLLFRLRSEKFDAVVYLPPSDKSTYLMERDWRFFKWAGIPRVIGMAKIAELPVKKPGIPLPEVSHEADILLSSLGASGLKVPPPGQGNTDLQLGHPEEKELQSALSGLPPDNGRPWLGVGPGAKQPANVWPAERYREAVGQLVGKHQVWPVVFGGAEDRETGDRLVREWGCGYNLAGLLSVRVSAAALKRCRLYLGNDTGTTHLAAAVKTPCVAVYASRQWPGYWYPYGPGHQVFRTPIECEGCLLGECIEKKMECILTIQADEVAKACDLKLRKILPESGFR